MAETKPRRNPPSLLVRFPGAKGPAERAALNERAQREGTSAAEWARLALAERMKSPRPLVPTAPAVEPDPDCPHPKEARRRHGYITTCDKCGGVVRPR